MSTASVFVDLHNGQAVGRSQLPQLDLEALRGAVVDAVAAGGRLVALFGAPHPEGLELLAVVADDDEGVLRVTSALVREGRFPSLTPAGSTRRSWIWSGRSISCGTHRR